MDLLDAADAIQRLLYALTRLGPAVEAQPAALGLALCARLRSRLDDIVFRLTRIVIRLIQHDAFPPTTEAPASEASPATPPRPPALAARPLPPRPSGACPLPRRPGWLLAALPDAAPAFADEISAILQDPALAALLAANPQTRRLLQPLCRMFGLATSGATLTAGRPSQAPPAARPQAPPSAAPHAPPTARPDAPPPPLAAAPLQASRTVIA